jgi:hypothetical protein
MTWRRLRHDERRKRGRRARRRDSSGDSCVVGNKAAEPFEPRNRRRFNQISRPAVRQWASGFCAVRETGTRKAQQAGRSRFALLNKEDLADICQD